jgi:predicted MPP superfamily phosphohydrolase
MRNAPFWWIFIGFVFLLDLYVFQVMRHLTTGSSSRSRALLHGSYWFISILSLALLIFLPLLFSKNASQVARSVLFALIAGLFLAKLLAALFFLTDDVRRALQWSVAKVVNNKTASAGGGEQTDLITRSAFLSWAGMLAGSGLFGALAYGMGNRYRYQVKNIQLRFAQLPAAFNGLRIVHISDIHAGSFTDRSAVERGVEKIMAQSPDLILFTGDLVNNLATEMDPYLDVFSRLQAPLGIYSVLGNHDYADYVRWDSPDAKQANLELLKKMQQQMGWRLLLNEQALIEKDGQQLLLLGVENWSAKLRFPKYGDLSRAYGNGTAAPFKILMSHDPSHWKAEVCEKYSDIALTLSGHTHGMQFGVELPGMRWSPVQYFYNEWAGLYEQAHQKLYVNTGFGFIGYPGRVGFLPEITLIELFSKD